MKIFKRLSLVFCAFGLILGLIAIVKAATSTVDLSTADNFAVLAGSTITNTGLTVVNGDLGLSPGTAVTGFGPGIVNGTQYINDATAIQAQLDLTAAYNDAAVRPHINAATELGGTTKISGVYKSDVSGTFGITGTLILDGEGDPNAVFIFQADTTLITAAASNVTLINGAQACNVFWQVGSSATLGIGSTLRGNILALTSVTLTTGAIVDGRVLASNGAVTMDTNIVTRAVCAIPPTPTPTLTPTNTPIPSFTAEPSNTPTPTPTLIPTNTETPTPTVTLLPTDTPVPTITIAPTLTLTPTNTVTPPLASATIQPTIASTTIATLTPTDIEITDLLVGGDLSDTNGNTGIYQQNSLWRIGIILAVIVSTLTIPLTQVRTKQIKQNI